LRGRSEEGCDGSAQKPGKQNCDQYVVPSRKEESSRKRAKHGQHSDVFYQAGIRIEDFAYRPAFLPGKTVVGNDDQACCE
jgi:hypothetical protein